MESVCRWQATLNAQGKEMLHMCSEKNHAGRITCKCGRKKELEEKEEWSLMTCEITHAFFMVHVGPGKLEGSCKSLVQEAP